MITNQHISDFLSRLEDEESKLLSWGYVDGGFSEDELYEMAVAWISDKGLDPYELIEELRIRRTIGEYRVGSTSLWRTRMAETVRLLSRLRQIFPNKSWKAAPTLVSDFRFSSRRRRYPARNISTEEVLNEISSCTNEEQQKVIEALLNRGEWFMLSRFQVQATIKMLEALKTNETKGMIVCAGTGTGKTLSFYLPALSTIAGWISKNEYWTKALALYPRNELLKDQFSETYSEARRIDDLLLREVGRKLRIGALYGSTPTKALEENVKKAKWVEEKGQGYICPFIKCPDDTCQSPLVWRYSDLKSQKEQLHCCNPKCGKTIQEDEVILTREKMQKEPPDILFTTTEMMNRLMSELSLRKLLGIDVEKKPRLVLLDEVHTYEGVHGAQVALLLRRWIHALRTPIHFTGLSATLEDAKSFFSGLVNVPLSHVDGIETQEDFINEGKEYQIILRGDPSSGASLLSSTIQTAMLMRRALDISNGEPSGKLFGSKVFIFTDDLDVTNRLYHYLLDAEGLSSAGRQRKEPLAILRRHNTGSDAYERLRNGQSWQMTENIGHDLRNSIPVGRTSSQDTGVSSAAEMIVATASLEVGYNDPEVGVVIQHKAPRDMASFLQRKGRAGRRRGMRPWTVTVLSDYGRDRIMYQGYEMLFDPVLGRRKLPFHNRYVLRMQAVYAFLDWVTQELSQRSFTFGHLWNDFSSPSDSDYIRNRQKLVAELIEDVLTKSYVRSKLESYLRYALDIEEEEVAILMWDPPRSLMLSVLPSLRRRLKSNWRKYVPPKHGTEHFVFGSPLSEFIPANLFSDLTLPEITILLPNSGDNQNAPTMPIVQAMNQFAPGRVTRRFGVHQMKQSHWIGPPLLESSLQPQKLLIEQITTEYEELEGVQYIENGKVYYLSCLRPWNLRPVQTTSNIGVTSNASLLWKSQIQPNGTYSEDKLGYQLNVPVGTHWSEVIKDVRFFTHGTRSSVKVKRFAIGSQANVRYNKQELDIAVQFYRDEDNPVALGFILEADGLVFRYKVPTNPVLLADDANQAKVRAFRTLYFLYRVKRDARFDGIANNFQRERLGEVYLSSLTATSLKNGCSLQEANEMLKGIPLYAVANKVLTVIFQVQVTEDIENDEDEEDQQYQRTHEKLLDLCKLPKVDSILRELACVLWEDPDNEWHEWALERWKTTLGSAILEACKELSVQNGHNDLTLDIGGGAKSLEMEQQDDGLSEIWITESTSGGGGIIEEVVTKYKEDPRRFFRLVESALGPSDMELVDSELTRCLELAGIHDEINQLFDLVRSPTGMQDTANLLTRLQNGLRVEGVLVTHPVMNSLYNRILKPGSSKETDDLLLGMVRIWKAEEERLGIEMDARIFAYVFSTNDEIVLQFKRALQHIDPETISDVGWRYQIIFGLLWPRGNQVRTRTMSPYNPFTTFEPMDRELLIDSIVSGKKVLVGEESWWELTMDALRQDGNVQLVADASKINQLHQALLRIVREPVEVGSLHLYARVEGLRRETDYFIATLDIREV